MSITAQQVGPNLPPFTPGSPIIARDVIASKAQHEALLNMGRPSEDWGGHIISHYEVIIADY